MSYITILTFAETESLIDQNTIIYVYDGDINVNNFTNYEQGNILSPNGKKMLIKKLDVTDLIKTTILNTVDGYISITDLNSLITNGQDIFANFTLLDYGTDITIPETNADFLLYKMENYAGKNNEYWNPNIVLRIQNINNIKTPPINIEIYNENKTLLGTFNFPSDWDGVVSTNIEHQITYFKIIYTTNVRNSFSLKIDN